MHHLKELIAIINNLYKVDKKGIVNYLPKDNIPTFKYVINWKGNDLERPSKKEENGLFQKISDLLLTLPVKGNKFNSREKLILKLTRFEVVAQICEGLKARNAAFHLNKYIFRKSFEIYYTKGCLNSSRFLSLHYGAFIGDLRLFNRFKKEFLKQRKISELEYDAELCFAQYALHYTKVKHHSEEIKNNLAQYFQDLSQVSSEFVSPHFQKLLLLIGAGYFESNGEYTALIKFLDTQLVYFENINYRFEQSFFLIYTYQITVYLKIKKVDLLPSLFDSALATCKYKSKNWFRVKELYVKYLLRNESYYPAQETLDTLFNVSNFKYQNENQKERLELLNIYLNLVLALNENYNRKQVKTKFKFYKSLNSLPKFDKDKRGMNVSIIIAQLVYLIILKDDLGLESRLDAIKKYMQRYMKRSPLYRSYTFIKMIEVIKKYNFHAIAIERNTVQLLQNLKNVSFENSNHPKELEIIEYDVLWRKMLKFLHQ